MQASTWARLGATAALVTAGGVLAGCAGGGTASGSGSSTSTSPATSSTASSSTSSVAPASATGCGTSAKPGSTTLDLASGGRNRVVVVHVPSAYTGTTPVALVLNLHGSGGTAVQQELVSGMDATSDADGFLVAYPQALIKAGAGFDWNIPGVPLFGGAYPPASSADDVAFLTGLAGQLASKYCIDLHRVYATGLSGGGRMASQLACDSATTFAAVAPVAGLRLPTPCPGTRAVPVVAFHGTADPIDPYGGHGQAYWTYSVPVAAARWASQDHCGAEQSASASGYTLTTYSSCAGGAEVELYTVGGEGHEWPGGPHLPRKVTALLGPQSTAVDADSTMWAFFSAHPLP
jgi:polyhydroxybutyrate depolymerase